MKRMIQIGLPLMLAAAILVAGLLLPQRLASSLRRSYLRQESAVTVAEVHSYGDSQDTLDSLLTAARLMLNFNAYEVDMEEYAVPESDWTDEQRAAYLAAYDGLTAFLYQWDEALAERILQDCGAYILPSTAVGSDNFLCVLVFGQENEQVFYDAAESDTSAETGTVVAAGVSVSGGILFDPETGIPVYIEASLYLNDLDSAPEPDWTDAISGLTETAANAYTACTGIDFSDSFTQEVDDQNEGWENITFSSYSSDNSLRLYGSCYNAWVAFGVADFTLFLTEIL